MFFKGEGPLWISLSFREVTKKVIFLSGRTTKALTPTLG